MKQQLTFNEIEQISNKCRGIHTQEAGKIGPLSLQEIDRIERDARQMRSEMLATIVTSLFKAIGEKITALTSALKSGGHSNKAMGASAR